MSFLSDTNLYGPLAGFQPVPGAPGQDSMMNENNNA